MATQTLLVPITTGLTLTAKLYTVGVPGTVVATADSVTEVNDGTNATGVYQAAFTDVPAGSYLLVPFLSGTALGEFGPYQLTLTTATFRAVSLDTIKAKTDQLTFTVAGQVDANAVAGGGGDATLAKQDAILAKFATTTLISQPVSTTGQITAPVVIGDDYLAHNGRAFEWTIGEPAGAVLAESSAKFGMKNLFNGDSFVVSGTITDAGGGNWLLSFDVPRTATQSLRCGKYNWTVEVTDEDGSEMAKVIPETGTYATLIEKAT